MRGKQVKDGGKAEKRTYRRSYVIWENIAFILLQNYNKRKKFSFLSRLRSLDSNMRGMTDARYFLTDCRYA